MLTDHPNHLARFHIRESLDASPALQNFYQMQDSPFEYWGLKIFMLSVGPILGVEKAGYLFAYIAIYLPFAGCLTLNRVVTGRTNIFVLCGLLFVFSEPAGWGFTNFLFTMGISIFALAGWIRTDKTDWRIRLGIFIVVATAIAYLHLISVVLLGFTIFIWEIARAAESRTFNRKTINRLCLLGVVFLPSFALFLKEIFEGDSGSGLLWGSAIYHLRTLFSPIVFMSRRLNFALHLLPLAIIYLYLRKPFTEKAPLITFNKPLLYVAGVVYLIGIVTPVAVSGIYYIGMRFPVLAAFIAVAAITDVAGSHKLKNFSILGIVLLIKGTLVHVQLAYLDNRITEMREAAINIPNGSKIAMISSGYDEKNIFDPRPITNYRYLHAATYLITDKDALTPSFFYQFSVGMKPEHDAYTVDRGYRIPDISDLETPRLPDYMSDWRQNFDIVLLLRHDERPASVPGTTVLYDGSWFSYLKIETPKPE